MLSMAKRVTGLTGKTKSSSRKTAKRLAAKREMLALKASKRQNKPRKK